MAGFPLLGAILAWLTLKTRSPWAAALAHGAFNAIAGVAFFFLQPGFDTAVAGSPLGLAGWIPMGLLVAGLFSSSHSPLSPHLPGFSGRERANPYPIQTLPGETSQARSASGCC